ncbi:MAG: molecular chaperone DnaJ [Candidatus Aenigmarchaeota archaeon]|nr:molecular chaperone DnaJ [Candidatus Aenigmarchaeota archaeon]
MVAKDYYETLGVSRNATQEEIKKAFRKLAREWHPDVSKNTGAEARFKEINEAFQTLGEPEKRKHYDQFGSAPNGQASSGAGFEDIFGRGFEDIFESFGFSQTQKKRKGSDLRYDIEMTLEQAFDGITKKIRFPHFEECRTCKGTGASILKTCNECHGSGEIKRVQRSFLGQFISVTTCTRCRGTGKMAEKVCRECGGSGGSQIEKEMEIEIPAGADDGQYIRFTGEGGPGENGGPYGDLYVLIRVKEHSIFEREGNNLYCTVYIDLGTAMLGGEVDVQTIDGKAKLIIPPGTQSHTIFRMKGEGMPTPGSAKRGDQMVRVVVEIPKKLTRQQEDGIRGAFEKNAETKKGFFERVKEYF